MKISKINSIPFGSTKKPESENDKKVTCGNFSADFKTSKAAETAGRAQVIKMPVKKRTPESIEEICDYFTRVNSSKIQKYKTGEIKPLFDFVNPNDVIANYEEQNERLEILKGLDDKRFLGKFSPKHDYLFTARNYISSNELMAKNIEVLNSMDERLLPKIKAGSLISLLGNENLEQRASEIASADDKILMYADRNAIMDYLSDTNLFSSSAQLAEYMSVMPSFDELPETVQQGLIDGKISLDVNALRQALGKTDAKIIQFNPEEKK